MKKYRLTASQKLLLYFQLLNRKKSDGNVCGSFTIREKVDFEKLKKAVNYVVEKNDSFRTRICFSGLSFKQYFKEYEAFDIEIINVKTDDDVKKIENKMNDEAFSMLKKSLFKIKFFRFEDGTGGIVCCMHHVICDAWTIGLAINELMAYYTKDEKNFDSYPYYEHINDQKKYLSGTLIKKDEIFWQNFFKNGVFSPATMIGDLNKVDKSRKSKFYKAYISKEIMDDINEYCQKKKISVCSFFTGVFSLYIGLESQLQEFLLDTIISNRASYKDKHTAGLFAKTLPFKASLREEIFENYIININKDLVSVYKHYKYPTKKLLKIVKSKEKKRKRTSKIWFSFQNAKTNNDALGVPFVTRWTPLKSTYLYDILIELFDLENNGGLDIMYHYLESKYTEKRISEIHSGINIIIDQVLKNPNINIKDIQDICFKKGMIKK